MASSLRRPARVCGGSFLRAAHPQEQTRALSRESFTSAGREYSKLLSSAQAHCWQSAFLTTRRRGGRDFCELLMYYVLGSF